MTAVADPVRSVAGNLVWPFTGEVHAIYKILPPTTPRMPMRERRAWHARVTAAVMCLPESMILGITRPVEPDRVVERMVEGVDLMAHPAYAADVRGHRDALAKARLTERSIYLVAKLPADRQRRLAMSTASAAARFSQHFGIVPLPPSGAERKVAHQAADDLAGPLANLLGERRVQNITEAEVRWLYARALYRGTAAEPRVSDLDVGAGTLGGPSLVALNQAVMLEGGDDSDVDRPQHPRFTVLDNEQGRSYQTFFTLATMPTEWVYPHGTGACLSRLARLGYPLDWCARITPTANTAARTSITAAMRKLGHQFGEYDGDMAGAPESLSVALATMRAELGRLSGSPATPELQVTITICLSADSLAELEQRAIHVRRVLEANEFSVPRPFGDQDQLWAAMRPASRTSPVVGHYSQFMLPEDFAGLDPFAGSELGDPIGPMRALNMDDSNAPVLFSIGYGPSVPAPRGPMSGNVALIGKLRSGKSWFAKLLMRDTVVLGGQVLVTDRTEMGEYVRLAPHMPGRTQIVRIGADSGVCLDPLRVFYGEPAMRYGTGFLTTLTSTPPTSAAGIELESAVRRTVQRGGALRDVAGELDTTLGADVAELARKLESFSRTVGLARCVFADGDPVDLSADYIVFHCPSLNLPSQEKLSNPVLAARLLGEEIFSMALVYLIMAIQAHVAFSDRSRFCLVVNDELYAISASPDGTAMLVEMVKGGPKHNAGLLAIAHLASEIPAAVTDGLGAKFMFRTGRGSAKEGLVWMGMEPNQDAIDSIADDAREPGQCLMVDREGRAGLIHTLEPRDPGLRAALDTGLSRVRPTTETPTHRARRPQVMGVSA